MNFGINNAFTNLDPSMTTAKPGSEPDAKFFHDRGFPKEQIDALLQEGKSLEEIKVSVQKGELQPDKAMNGDSGAAVSFAGGDKLPPGAELFKQAGIPKEQVEALLKQGVSLEDLLKQLQEGKLKPDKSFSNGGDTFLSLNGSGNTPSVSSLGAASANWKST